MVVDISRRTFLALGTGALAAYSPGIVRAVPDRLQHGFSPLGALRYAPGFTAFDYVDVAARKGGTMRFARMGAFQTLDTLHYPAQPPADVRLIYDRLIVASDDETASYYGALAESMAVADDFSVIAFRLHPGARWHSGEPVLAEDVVFTFESLKAEGAPFYRQAFRPLTLVAETEDRVVFLNDRLGDRDVVRRIATIPIHPSGFWRDRPSAEALTRPVGSGPYRVAEVDPPRRLVLERVPDYWGADLGVNRGRWNFDRLTFDYYRDADVALQAFAADAYDLRIEESPARWSSGYDGPALQTGEMLRTVSPTFAAGVLHGIVFNLRRRPLADRRVRLALTLAYDFDTVNQTLFAGGYQRFESVFGDTDLAATGPVTDGERSLLSASEDTISPDLLGDPDPLDGLPPAGSREALSQASRLLDEAGYPIRDGRRIDAADNTDLAFAVVSPSPLYEGPLTWIGRAWERLGVGLVRVRADPATASRQMLDRDFDLATLSWTPERLPGTAERLLWHSDLADAPNSYALSGIKSPSLDTAIEALETARAPTALRTAARAFDRTFRHACVMLPLWRDGTTRLAWWNRFERPAAEGEGLPPSPADRWWAKG